jgi:SOS-response transcriptional repressor LexA
MTDKGVASVATERGLTAAQQLTLDAVRDYIATWGISPTFRDVMRSRKLKSTSTVQAHFRNLQAAGAIELRDGVPRSVRVLWPTPERLGEED